jgi:superfamily I DNA/RNA helicase
MLKGLSEQQIEAVLELGNVLLTACPGSGKTRTLTYKIAYELQKIPQSKKIIVAVTFTNRAADEIKKRIQTFYSDDTNLWAGTIHAFCLEWIIRPYRCYLNELKNGFSVSDEYNTEKLIGELKKEYGLGFFDPISTRYMPSGEIEEQLHQDLINEYHHRLKKEKLIDFDQILHYAYRLVSEYPLIPEILKSMFHLVCIDEYQDTQELQYAIFAKIMLAQNGNCKMFMVGDADQAIYSSLGGVAKSHEEIEILFRTPFVKKELSGNYRSNQQIINYYRNFQTTDIDIVALGNNAIEDAIITYNKTIHKNDIDTYIAELIQEKIDSGVPEHEICILAPTWYMVIPMGRKLKARLPDVSFDAVGLSPLLKNKENIWFKIARMFLVAPSPKTFIIRKRWVAEIVSELTDIGITLFEDSEFKSKKLLKLLNSISSQKENGLEYLEDCFISLCEFLDIRKDSNDYLNLHWNTFFEGAKARLEDPAFDLAQDINSFKRMFSHEQGVVVNTCHGIKGEEFDTVIAFGLLQGKLPNWNERNDNAAKKLLYVICSRAKRELHLISETGWKTNSNKPYFPTYVLNSVKYDYTNRISLSIPGTSLTT